MATIMENKESSPDPDDLEESAEYSAELKLSEHSTGRPPRKVDKPSTGDDVSNDFSSETKNLRRITEVLGSSGIEDEISTSPPTNSDNVVGNARDSDFHYTGNSGVINTDGEEMTKWDTTRQKIKKIRNFCGKVVNNERVQYAIVVCILINAIMMGIATYSFIKDDNLAEPTFRYADLGFLIIFTIELIFQGIYHGPRLLLDGWLVFDLVVVIVSWLAVPPSSDGPNLQVLRAFRIFRALRLVTRIKTMKDLVVAIFNVMPRMMAIFLMLLLIFYIFAVMFTQLYSGATWTEENLPDEETQPGDPIIYFITLDQSMLTLFQLMTMDEWANIVRALAPQHRWNWFYMILFVIISGFIVVNLIVAVICDAIGSLSDSDKNKLQGRYDEDDSQESRMDLRVQIDMIEDQIGDLTRIQARTFHTLQYLTQQLQREKEKSAESSNTPQGEESTRSNSGDSKEKRPNLMKKSLSSERSRRKGLAQTGFVSKRKNFTDTWTQEGSDKTLRRAMVTNFAKSARELQKMRDREESEFATSALAKSLRDLKAMREEEQKFQKEEIQKEENTKTFEEKE